MKKKRREWTVTFTDQALKDLAFMPVEVKKEFTAAIKRMQEDPCSAGEQISGRRVFEGKKRDRELSFRCDKDGFTNMAYRDVYWVSDRDARADISRQIFDQQRKEEISWRNLGLGRRPSTWSQNKIGRKIMEAGKLNWSWGRLCRGHSNEERRVYALLWWHRVT